MLSRDVAEYVVRTGDHQSFYLAAGPTDVAVQQLLARVLLTPFDHRAGRAHGPVGVENDERQATRREGLDDPGERLRRGAVQPGARALVPGQGPAREVAARRVAYVEPQRGDRA